MFNPAGILLSKLGFRKKIYKELNNFLADVVNKIKENFGGKISYASGTWENIDWDLFDFIGIDHYLASYNKSTYVNELKSYFRFNKPVAVLEFGCCSYKGADKKGGAGWAITEIENERPVIKKGYIRDETVQANYIVELLDIFKVQNVYAAFVFTFINPMYKFNINPKYDLDMASYGIVKPINDSNENSYLGLPWIPKKAFYRLAEYYEKIKNDTKHEL